MTHNTRMSNLATAVAVVVALLVGILGSLAIRPAGVVATSTTAQTGQAGSAPRIRWKVPTAFNTNVPVTGTNIVYVSKLIERASSGAINLEIFEPNELVSPLSIIDAVRDRKVDAGYTWLGYEQGKIPAAPLISAVPFGMEPWEFTAWWYDGEGQALGEALFQEHNIHPVLCGIIGPETAGWFRKPIESPSDFEGLKIRFAGLGGKVLQRAGASVTLLPAGEIFQALEKGAIDATEFSLPVADQALGFDRVAKFNYFPGWHQPFTTNFLTVNLDAWNELADADQAMVEMACTAGVIHHLASGEAAQGKIIKGFPDKGVSARRLSQSTLDYLRKLSNEVLQEEAAKDPHFAKILASQIAFSADYAYWKRLAYLPWEF